MNSEKKYTAQEAAIAVLRKAEELLKKSYVVGKNSEKEEIQGEPVNPGDRVKEQTPPDMNPKEQAEGNNKEWGTAPTTYGHLKLAKFIGYMHAKRKTPKNNGVK